MIEGLRDYVSEHEKDLNLPLIHKSADEPLVEYVIDAWKSLEVVKAIKFDKFEYTDDESQIDINKHMFKREKKRKKKDRFDVKFISDHRVGQLTVYFTVTILEKDPSTGESAYQVYPIKKSMLIPLQNEEGYYFLKNKRYYMIYQLLEKSTYTSASSVTLKSLMPVAVKRNSLDAEDMLGRFYHLPYYSTFVFRKEIPVLLFYMSKGAAHTLDYLGVSNVISFINKYDEKTVDHDKYLYFGISSKCYLQVNREMFHKYAFVQSVVGGFLQICTNRTTLNQLENSREWIKRIVTPNNYEKGFSILKSFNRLMDITTQKKLEVDNYHKRDIYALLRWMMQEFNELRQKDNCDLNTKRLRCNEYIASLLTKDFSRRLQRVISYGDKATIDNIREIFKFPGDREYVAVKAV